MPPSTLDKKRFRAVLVFRESGLRDAANAAEVTIQHLHYVLAGERKPSKRMLTALQRYLGDAAWKWVTRVSDVSPDAISE